MGNIVHETAFRCALFVQTLLPVLCEDVACTHWPQCPRFDVTVHALHAGVQPLTAVP